MRRVFRLVSRPCSAVHRTISLPFFAGSELSRPIGTRHAHRTARVAVERREMRTQVTKVVSADQIEISRLRAELARVKMERDILGKATAYFAKAQS